jgi:hypothetical protein
VGGSTTGLGPCPPVHIAPLRGSVKIWVYVGGHQANQDQVEPQCVKQRGQLEWEEGMDYCRQLWGWGRKQGVEGHQEYWGGHRPLPCHTGYCLVGKGLLEPKRPQNADS